MPPGRRGILAEGSESEMKATLKWGKGEAVLQIPDKNVLAVLEPSGGEPVPDLAGEVARLVKKPTAGPSLEELVRAIKPRTAAVIVNDMTRSTPSDIMLPPLLEELERSGVPRDGISVVVATGTHRPMTDDETRQTVGDEVFARYRVENHDCDSPDLVDMGTLSTGNRVLVNKTVAEADLRLAIGEVLLHYYAGFAGGRKSVFPGVAGRETVMTNHRMMTAPGVGIGVVDGNVVSEEMVEAVREFCHLHFILNCVSDSSKRIVRVVGGHWYDAWREGINTFKKYNFAPIPKKADVVFISAGGYPKDINMYQAHKAMFMGARALRPGGTMVFFAELAEGYGHKVFEEWALRGLTPEGAIKAFEADFRFGAHKLYYLAKLAIEASVLLYSNSNGEDSRRMFCEKVSAPEEILPILVERYGEDFTSYVIPQGGIVLPTEEN